MRKFLPVVSLATVAGLTHAQQLVVPKAQSFASTGTTPSAWRTTLSHFQTQFDDTYFTANGVSGPITIHRIRYRTQDGVVHPGGNVYNNVIVKMAHNPVNFTAMSTTFATNLSRSAGGTVVYGPASVTMLPATGGVPNDYAVDITLTTPFVYDPTLGDLLIDVTAPSAPAPTTVPMLASSSSIGTHLARGVTTDTAALAGSFLDAVPVTLLDFTGPGGYANVTGAQVHAYGAACYSRASSVYQTFAAGDPFDLANSGLTFTPAGPDSYTVTTGAAPIQAPSGASTRLSVADDAVVAVTLPFTFTFPGGSTTVINPCTNGFIWLGSDTNTDFTPTPLEFRNSLARLAPCWQDFDAGRNTTTHPGSGLFHEFDGTTNPADPVALVTWNNIGTFRSTLSGQVVVNFQCAIHQNSGVVEFRYGTMPGPSGTNPYCIVGFSRGGTSTVPAVDPGSRDLSRELPYTTTGPDAGVTALQLTCGRPVLATTVTLSTANVPTSAVFSVQFVTLGQFSPGVNLTTAGAPNCLLSVDLSGLIQLNALAGTGTVTSNLVIPNDVSLIGGSVYIQTAAIDPTANALGALTSNALQLVLGLL